MTLLSKETYSTIITQSFSHEPPVICWDYNGDIVNDCSVLTSNLLLKAHKPHQLLDIGVILDNKYKDAAKHLKFSTVKTCILMRLFAVYIFL